MPAEGAAITLIRVVFLVSLLVIGAMSITAMVVVTNDLTTTYNDGLALFLGTAVLYLEEHGMRVSYEFIAYPNNTNSTADLIEGMLLLESALTWGLVALRDGNETLGVPAPIVSDNITRLLDEIQEPANLTLDAVSVIEYEVLVAGATYTTPTMLAAFDVIFSQYVIITPLLQNLQADMTRSALLQSLKGASDQYTFMGIIIGLLVLIAVFVYIPVEARVRHLIKDIVAKKESMRQLADQLTTVTQLSPNGIFRTDADGKLVFVNDQWRNITGIYNGLDSWMDNIETSTKTAVIDQWTSALRSSQRTSTEFIYVRPDQQTVWIKGQVRTQLDEASQVCGMVGAFTDITESKRLEREKMEALQLAAKQAEDHMREQARFVDIICHEIRNPLNGIVNNTDVLRSVHKMVLETLESQKTAAAENEAMLQQLRDTADLWDSIELCANHQRRITDDVLQISRLREGRFSMVNSAMSITRLVDAIMRMFQAEADAAGIKLTCRYSDAVLSVPRFVGDSQRIGQILINLVGNAVKFTRKTPVREVNIEVDVSGDVPEVGQIGQVTFRVQDTGIGMSVPERARLFVPFGQANIKTYSKYGGSGMGLFISKALLDLMNGQIHVESEPGHGSTFSVAIPCMRTDDDAPIDAEIELFAPHGYRLAPSESRRTSKDTNTMTTSPPGPPTSGELAASSAAGVLQATVAAAAAAPAPPAGSSPSPPPVPKPSSVSSPKAPAAYIGSALSRGGSPAPLLPPDRRYRVLVVEDNDINQKVLKRQMETAPGRFFDVDLADDGQQAFNMSAEKNYDLIIMDVEMPVMGGLESTQLIRAREVENNLPPVVIIGLSGNARLEHVQAGLAAGMTDYLEKPCRQPALLACVSKHLGIKIGCTFERLRFFFLFSFIFIRTIRRLSSLFETQRPFIYNAIRIGRSI